MSKPPDVSDAHRRLGRENLLPEIERLAIPIDNGAKPTGVAAAGLTQILAACRFDIHNPPPRPEPRFRLNGAVIATPGNLVGVAAQAKHGKSAFLSACAAATMQPTGDCLGVTSSNPDGLALIHFDAEQSPVDHHELALTALRRAGRTEPPQWFRSYCLTNVPLLQRRAAIAFELERAASDCGGIHSVILDGLADFCVSPNDDMESFAFIDELHQLAIRYDTTSVCVLHENPGSETGKTRGHLGSQLERKAETNLRLAKDADGVTTVYAEKARHAHIPKDLGPRFAWSQEEGMHVSVAAAAECKASAKRERLAEFAAEVFRDTPASIGLAWKEVRDRIVELEHLKPEGARRRFDTLRTEKVIQKRGDRYHLSA